MAELKPKRKGNYHHNGNPKHGLYHGCDYDMTLIDEQPTVDAVEVVRCKDCKHCTPDENIIGAYGYCYHFGCYAHEPMVEADDFCSYGERKDNV